MQVHDTPWLFPSKRPTISDSLQSWSQMPTIELNFPAYTVMPRIVCSEVPKKKFIVLNMRRLKFDDGPHLPRHFRSSLTRVTHNIGLLGKPTVQILIFTPVQRQSFFWLWLSNRTVFKIGGSIWNLSSLYWILNSYSSRFCLLLKKILTFSLLFLLDGILTLWDA